MQAAPLLNLHLTHQFYADLRCSDLAIISTTRTKTLMRKLRLTCKTFPDHVSFYAGLGMDRAAAAPATLDFVLRPREPDFALITDLTGIYAQTAPVFTNAGVAPADPLNLRLTTRTARGLETLAVRAPSVGESFRLAGTPLPGTTAADFTIVGAGAVTSLSADLRSVTVDTSTTALGATFQLSYPVRPDRARGALAEVVLALDAALLVPAASPRAFVIPFAAAAARWAYYIVMDFLGDVSTFRIVDATRGDAPRGVTFGDAGRVDLTLEPDRSDAVGLDLVRRNPGRRVLRMVSDKPVPAREIPLRQLELHLADVRLIAAMPNPRPDRFVSLRTAPSPSAAETVLYDVLMLLSN